MKAQSHDLPAAGGFSAPPDAVVDAANIAIRAGACPRCALEQARDWASVTRWLARCGPEAHEALGIACCPLHTWRLALGVSEGAAMDRMDWVDRLTALYASALDHLLHDAQVAMTRLERTGVARWLMSSRALAPGWFAERPACPLCARLAREVATSQESGQAGLEAGQEAPLCGEHRAREAGQERLARGEAAEAAHARWWLAPGASAQDVAFIRRLLRAHDEPRFPDDLCPLCVARMRHERVLIAALAAGESFETVWLGPAELLAEPLAGAAPKRSDMRIDPATLCGRHTALLRVSTQDAGGGAGSVSGDLAGDLADELIGHALAADAPGALRAETSERNCPACAILHAWELARIEGLHRAAGGAPLSESTTARLVWELEHARYPFCAPHLRKLLQFGPAETTWAALGPSLTQTLEDLRERLETARQGDAGVLILPVIQFAAAALGGAPA